MILAYIFITLRIRLIYLYLFTDYFLKVSLQILDLEF